MFKICQANILTNNKKICKILSVIYWVYYFCFINLGKMKDFFGFIEFLFVDILFAPLDMIRSLELKSWILANGINFLFIIIISALLVYWMIELVKYDKAGEEDKDPSAHSFL